VFSLTHRHDDRRRVDVVRGCLCFNQVFNHISCTMASTPSVAAALCIFLIVQLISESTSFNLEVNDVVVHRGPRESMFGFSVAQHISHNQGW
jgi:hypothetical protein